MNQLCHAIGCTVGVPPRALMCPRHWSMVPTQLRDAVLDNYRPGQEHSKRPTPSYLEAAEAAVNAVAAIDAQGAGKSAAIRIPAITIWQPWASLIMIGAQPWEWRRWPAPDRLVGQRIGIHADARPVGQVEIDELIEAIGLGDTSMIAEPALDLLRRTPKDAYPTGHMLGSAILGQPTRADEWARQHDIGSFNRGHIHPNKWAWPLTDHQPLVPSIPCRGGQGFWDWSV